MSSNEVVAMAHALINTGGQDPNDCIRLTRWKVNLDPPGSISSLRPEIYGGMCAIHVARGNMLQMLLDCGADPKIQDQSGSTALDIHVGSPCSGFQPMFTHILEHKQYWEYGDIVNTDLDVLLQKGAKLTRRGELLRPTFLRLGLKLSPHVRDRLENVEILGVQVKIDDIPDYSLLNDAQIQRVSGASFYAVEPVIKELERMCEKGRRARNKRLGLARGIL